MNDLHAAVKEKVDFIGVGEEIISMNSLGIQITFT